MQRTVASDFLKPFAIPGLRIFRARRVLIISKRHGIANEVQRPVPFGTCVVFLGESYVEATYWVIPTRRALVVSVRLDTIE